MADPSGPPEMGAFGVQSRTKRLRGYRLDDFEPPEVTVVMPQPVVVDAPLADNVQSPLARGPLVVVKQVLDDCELKVVARAFAYDMEDDNWDETDLWYGRGALTNLSEGTAQGERIGRKIIVRRVVYEGFIKNADSETIQTAYRLVVVRDSQRPRVTMDANNELMTGTELIAHYRPWNVGGDKRYQVLHDQVFNPQKKVTGTQRIPFRFTIDVPDEVATFIDSDEGWWPNYYLISTYNDDTIHLVLPRLEYTVAVYYVDA